MFLREPQRLDDAILLTRAIRNLMKEGLDRRGIEKALVTHIPVDLDLLAGCYAQALRSMPTVPKEPKKVA
ncbi:hypothetical protein DYI37_01590 [Fulvimarina endophytica]|uniref:Uncharacterized protein n=1 Tax=Fulvimarina endophytica TaxID=2293836 RepID=A0A371XAD5_9HYPH|nr:hypothetical protein [Fulvimarina endophytica]RFC66185.1 hypothetical protein DYI37_01590 [Fulvimarina endophytica]